MKKILSITLAFVFAFSCFTALAFTAGAADGLTVTACSASEPSELNAVRWFPGDNGEYYFFIPSYWNADEVLLSASAAASINGTEIAEGETYSLGEKGVITSSGKDYNYFVVSGSDTGTVFISTESGSLDAVHADKSHKEPGSISVKNAKGKEQTENSVLEYIKGRGNASWEGAKKPYNIKLDKKAKLLGMAKSKKWCLIANYDDDSLMRNAVVYNTAADAGLAYSPENAPVDLYVNNEYLGSYLLTSRIEPAGARIDIEDLDEINEEIALEKNGEDFDMDTLPPQGTYGSFAGLLEGTNKYVDIPASDKSTVNGGYILEMEIANRYIGEKTGFVSKDGQPFTMKSPEFASKEQIEFISDYYQRTEDAIISGDGKNEKGEDYKDLIDAESFAKYYTVCEWSSNMDTGLTSTYFYLDSSKDGVLYAGPVWDYDLAFGNNGEKRYGLDYTDPEQFTVAFGRQYRNTVYGRMDVDEKPTVFNYLCQKQDFADECKKVWDSSVYEAVSAWCGESFDEYAALIEDSAVMNHIRWNTFGTRDAAKVRETYLAKTAELKAFASKRADFLNKNLGTVQQNPVKTNFVLGLLKKAAAGLNNAVEKLVVLFSLQNKRFGFLEY